MIIDQAIYICLGVRYWDGFMFTLFYHINRDILDKDEKFDIPKAADSHITTSVFDNEVVK